MKNPEKTRDIWYHLDNAAILFPAISTEDNTNVFRLACALHEAVDGEVLQRALDDAITSFPYFQVVMRRGLFWFYLERTSLRPIATPEHERPCGRLFYKNRKELLFKVTYFQNRINLECFHAVADGGGALDLLRNIVHNYLLIQHGDALSGERPLPVREPSPHQQKRDSFQHYYDPSDKASPFKGKAYTIGGTLLPSHSIRIISARMPTKQILALAKSKGATATAYLAALMVCAIHDEMMPRRLANRTIGVTVPVDLRSHYSSETSRNFFSVVDVGYNFGGGSVPFEEVLASISEQLTQKTQLGSLTGRLNYNMSVQKNIFTRFTPLLLKNFVLRKAYHKAESATTCALSNMGRITMPDELAPYIEGFSCLLNPTRLHRFKACVCSYGDNFVINLTSCIAETSMHRHLIRHLSREGIDVTIICNGEVDHEIL